MEISSKNGKYNNATSKKKLNEFNLSDINEDEIERLTLTSIEGTTGAENSNNNNNINFFLNDFDNSKSIQSHKQQPQAAKNRINFKMSTMNSNEDSLNNSNKNSNLSMFKNNTAQTSDMTTLMHNNTNDNNMNNNNNNNTTNFFSNGPNSPFSLNRYGPNRNYGHSSRSTMEFYRLKLSRSKLKAVTRTSALLSGFAMVAMVELNLDYSDYFESILKENNKLTTTSSTTTLMLSNSTVNSTFSTGTTTRLANVDVSDEVKKFLVPESVLILYALVTCLLVGVHMLALMISTCILPQIEATSFEQIDLEQFYEQRQHFLSNQQNLRQQMTADATTTTTNKQQPQHQTNNQTLVDDNLLLNESKMARAFNNTASNHDLADVVFPYNQFHRFIELAWISSTVLGIFLFLVEIGLVCYIKFYPISFVSALTGAVVMLPILVLFVAFTITFYKKLAHFKLNLTKHYLHQVDRNLQPLGGDHVI